MLITFGDQVPPLNEGWKYTLPETSGRWKDITKYTRDMSQFEVVQKWAFVAAISVLTLGVFALYLAYTAEGQENIRLLLQHRMVHYSTLQTPPYVSALTNDVRMVIENFLPLRDFIRFRAVCKQAQASVDKALRTNDNRTSEIADYLVKHGSYNLFYSRVNASNFIKNGIVFSKIIINMHNRIKESYHPINYSWNLFEKTYFSTEQLQSLPSPICQQIVDLSLQRSVYTKQHAEVYFECATPHILLRFAEIASQYTHSYDKKVGQLADSTVLEEFFREGRGKKLRVAHNKSGGTQEAFLSLILRLILKESKHNYLKHSSLKSARFLEEAITPQEFNNARLLMSDKEYIWCDIEIDYRALQLFQLCVSQLNKDEVRAECCHLIAQIQLHYLYRNNFLGSITTMLSSTSEEILSPNLIRRLIYALNGCKTFSAFDNARYLLDRWKDDVLLCKYRSTILEEWTHSSDDARCNPNFDAIFSLDSAAEFSDTLIRESNTLSEPRRSLYLRAIAHGVSGKKIKGITAEAFERCQVPFPVEKTTGEEFFFQLTKSRDFFRKVQMLQSQQELEAVLDEVLQISSKEKKQTRLSFLGRGYSISFYRPNSYLTFDIIKKAFKNKMLDLSSYHDAIKFYELRGPQKLLFGWINKESRFFHVPDNLFLNAEKFESQEDLEAAIDETLQLPDEEQRNIGLCFLSDIFVHQVMYVLSSQLTYKARKAAFANKNLNIAKIGPILSFSHFTNAEAEDWVPANTEIKT